MSNQYLSRARQQKDDEFYTQYSTIADELKFYPHEFKDKTVYCNCDNPYKSMFIRYFIVNFNKLLIKKLIATCYNGQEAKYGINNKPYLISISSIDGLNTDEVNTSDELDNNNDIIDIILQNPKNTIYTLSGNGDFRSEECIAILKESDIVVTNPPFSIFREFVIQLMEYHKKFLILGNINTSVSKDLHKYITNKHMQLGVSIRSSSVKFLRPNNTNILTANNIIGKNNRVYLKLSAVRWFTNLDNEIYTINARINPTEKYIGNERAYQKYDNFDAINIDKISEIPCDYYGIMGVPITYLDKHNPQLFKILGRDIYTAPPEALTQSCLTVNGKLKYSRLLIQRI